MFSNQDVSVLRKLQVWTTNKLGNESSIHESGCGVMLATLPTRQNGSGLGLEPELNCSNGFTAWKTQTVGIRAGFHLKTRPCKPRYLASIKYLSSDGIVTWSVCRLCSSGRSVTSRFQLCDPTNIRWGTTQNPVILCKSARISQPLNEYQLDRKSERGRCKSH